MGQNSVDLRVTAEELGYSFFVCDEGLGNWRDPSPELLTLFGVSEESVLAHPRFWMDLVDWPSDVLNEKLASLSLKRGTISLTLPFKKENQDTQLVTLRFSRLRKGEEGLFYRHGSAEINKDEDKYKQEALQARDHEIEISARIQKILLTGAVAHELSGLEVTAETIPSKDVDGDFYEFLPLSTGVTDLIIGDVMGKGVPAALLAAAVKASYHKALIHRGFAPGESSSISEILGMVDSLITRNLMELNKFLTLYYCRFDRNKSLLSFIDAGHTSFIYYDKSEDRCWSLKGANMPMGFIADQDYREFLLPFQEGDLFFFYSDGISEVRDSEGEMFGQERIRQLVKAHARLGPDGLIKKVLNVMFFYAAGTFDDDVTAVAVRITGESVPPSVDKKKDVSRNRPEELESLRSEFTADLLDVYGWDREVECTKLTIALMEALANGISHTTGELTLYWRLFSGRAELSLAFSGADFDWLETTAPDPRAYSSRGYGSFLIHGGTDSSLLLKGKGEQKKLILVKEFS
ncbi:MAG: SpoIIE family protein phosphatase [Spirochaetales bacterium]|nr:SpoIIE family protein phosphatase [Spirochaetales bacterium]